MVSYFPVVTGSLTVTGSINVSGGITASGGISISGSIASASYASTASFVALAQSASNAVAAATASSADNLLVRNTLTAQTLVVQTVTSSVIYSSGSNVFGNNIANTQVMTGSVTVTGSLAVITTGTEFQVTSTGVKMGNIIGDTHSITGSALFSGSIGIGTTTPEKPLTVNFGTTILGGLLVTGSQRQETIFRSNGEHSNVIIDSGHSNTYLPNLSFQRLSTTFGSVSLARASNSDILGPYTESEMLIGSTTTVPFSLHTSGSRRLVITSAGNIGMNTLNIGTEANLHLGAFGASEGGQLILQKATSFASASHLDNYENQLRIMSGTDTSSSTVRMSVNMANGNVGIGATPVSSVKLAVAGTLAVGNTTDGASNLSYGGRISAKSTTVTGGGGATLIHRGLGSVGYFILVSGISGADRFTDLIYGTGSNTPLVLASNTFGSAPTRTYSIPGENISVSLSGGATWTVVTTGLGAMEA